MTGLFRKAVGVVLVGWALVAGAQAPVPETVVLFNREIAELRAALGGLSPAERALRAQRRFDALGAAELALPAQVLPSTLGDGRGLTLQIDAKPIFTLIDGDLDPEDRLTLAQTADRARTRLDGAARARIAQGEGAVLWRGAGIAAGVLAVWALGLWGVMRLHRHFAVSGDVAAGSGDTAPATYLRVFTWRVLAATVWLLMAVLVYAGTEFLLGAFPWTQPLGEHMAGFVRQRGGWLASGAMGAVPGLLTVLLVVLVARAIQDALSVFMAHVQKGTIQVPFLHADTVGATRRLLSVLVWGLAIAVAYPFLPGSSSDAFKGVSVLLGLVLTLGSTGLVTQLMSGLVIVYSRSLKKGDFVSVNGIEGVVSEVGGLAVKIVTMRNEEVTVPNGVITNSPIHNYSKLAGEQGTRISTKVTIGYDTPWRQVHALLLDAARKTERVRAAPTPFVYQRALSDFYVEYELFGFVDIPIQSVSILSALHAAIQDEFNTYGVQIMSPHFFTQPSEPPVVPRAKWFAAPAKAPAAGDR